MNLEQKKRSLADKAIFRNLTTMTAAEQQHLQDGLNKIPVYKVINLIEFLSADILPKIERAKGVTSEDYKQFKSIIDALTWSVHVNSMQDRLQYQWSNERLLCEFYREKCLFYERELMQHTTMDELAWKETFVCVSRMRAESVTQAPAAQPEPPHLPSPVPTPASDASEEDPFLNIEI